MFFLATCLYLRENLRVRLATQRKSLPKFNLRPLATSQPIRLTRALVKHAYASKSDTDKVPENCKKSRSFPNAKISPGELGKHTKNCLHLVKLNLHKNLRTCTVSKKLLIAAVITSLTWRSNVD